MVVVAVTAVLLAVARGQAGIATGLLIVLGPPTLYLITRARRIERGEEEPSVGEVALARLTVTALVAVVLAALIVSVALVAGAILRVAL